MYEKHRLYRINEALVTAHLVKDKSKAKWLIVLKAQDPVHKELIETTLRMANAKFDQEEEYALISFDSPFSLANYLHEYPSVTHVVAMGAEAKDFNYQCDLNLYKWNKLNHISILLVNDAVDVYGNKSLKVKFWDLVKDV